MDRINVEYEAGCCQIKLGELVSPAPKWLGEAVEKLQIRMERLEREKGSVGRA